MAAGAAPSHAVNRYSDRTGPERTLVVNTVDSLISVSAIEVRNESDLRQLVALTSRLLNREVTLQDIFPGYRYTRAD